MDDQIGVPRFPRIDGVMLRGRWLDRTELDALLDPLVGQWHGVFG